MFQNQYGFDNVLQDIEKMIQENCAELQGYISEIKMQIKEWVETSNELREEENQRSNEALNKDEEVLISQLS